MKRALTVSPPVIVLILVLRDLILRHLILILAGRCCRVVQHQQYARQDNSD